MRKRLRRRWRRGMKTRNGSRRRNGGGEEEEEEEDEEESRAAGSFDCVRCLVGRSCGHDKLFNP